MAARPDVAATTHPGRRRNNQDAVVCRVLSDDREIVAVADGMGGQAAGEVASARTLEVLLEELAAGAALGDAVRSANAAVHRDASEHAERHGMGTTLVALLRTGNTYHVANVGDSRAYRVTGAGVEQVTADHSFAAEALREGRMTAVEAAASPWRNALTRALGTDADVDVDLFGPFPVDPPHVVVLCSDGVYKALPDEVIWRYVLGTPTVGAAVESLAALAYRRGSDDNISVAAVEFGRVSRRSPAVTVPVAIARQARVQGRSVAASSAPADAKRPRAPLPAPQPARRTRLGWVVALLSAGVIATAAVVWLLVAA